MASTQTIDELHTGWFQCQLNEQPMTAPHHINLSLQEFLLIERCPPEWRLLDVYLFRDGELVFYIGQSYLAFDRVWRHIRDGYKARSTVGHFLLTNWPASMKFSIELLSSQDIRFAALSNELLAVERALIEQAAPCFNSVLNRRPTPLPEQYAPPDAKIHKARSLKTLIREARFHLQAEEKRNWLAE